MVPVFLRLRFGPLLNGAWGGWGLRLKEVETSTSAIFSSLFAKYNGRLLREKEFPLIGLRRYCIRESGENISVQ